MMTTHQINENNNISSRMALAPEKDHLLQWPSHQRDQALSLWGGSTDSKTLRYQRTNPREYQIVRTDTKETAWIQDPATPNPQEHSVQDTSSKWQIKQKQKPNHQQTGLPPHSALPIRGKSNKQKTQHKSHPIQSLHKPLDQPKEGRNQKDERIQPWNLEKGDLKHNKLKKGKKKWKGREILHKWRNKLETQKSK